ncbi:MAG: M24 family metallopeptidase, partial [Microlunatus sp.]|nr:M24 family metallopeptidase [Microlunatus sp.]
MSVADAVRVVEPTSAYAEFDLRRMRRERLARTRHSLRAHQLPAALLFDPLNVWYAVVEGAMPVFNLHVSFRWALVPVESEPVLWEYPESMHLTGAAWSGDLRAAKGWSFFGSGSNSEADTRAFAAQVARVLSERGLLGEPIGVDRLETAGHLALAEAGITMVDAQPAMERARAIKTPDELIAIRTNARNCDRAIEEMLGRMRPGVTENQLWGTLVGTGLQTGALWCETRLLSSGPRTNPWMQEATHREVQDGDLVAFDTDLVGENGYLTDISRTY